jgi:hypothetical protein
MLPNPKRFSDAAAPRPRRLPAQADSASIRIADKLHCSAVAILPSDEMVGLRTARSTPEKYVQTALAKAILDQVLENGGRGSDELIERAGQLFAHLTSGESTAIGMEQVGQTTVAVAARSAAAGGGHHTPSPSGCNRAEFPACRPRSRQRVGPATADGDEHHSSVLRCGAGFGSCAAPAHKAKVGASCFRWRH